VRSYEPAPAEEEAQVNVEWEGNPEVDAASGIRFLLFLAFGGDWGE